MLEQERVILSIALATAKQSLTLVERLGPDESIIAHTVVKNITPNHAMSRGCGRCHQRV